MKHAEIAAELEHERAFARIADERRHALLEAHAERDGEAAEHDVEPGGDIEAGAVDGHRVAEPADTAHREVRAEPQLVGGCE